MKGKFLNNYLPALIWFFYHAAIPNWRLSFFSLLMLLRALIVLFCFLRRDEATTRAPLWQITFAWTSTFLPTLMVWEPVTSGLLQVGQTVAISGMILFIYACLDLDRSFGVSPAIRCPVSTGLYNFISHPVYISHIVVEIGLLIASPTSTNFQIAGLVWLSYWLRAYWEKRILVAKDIQVFRYKRLFIEVIKD